MSEEERKLIGIKVKLEVQELINENEKLHSIIKEVREYIEELAEDTEDYIGEIDRRRKVELLGILDKENNNEDN